MRLDASIVIDRPVGDVWRFYAVNHVQNHPTGLGTFIRRRNSRSGMRRSTERIKSLMETEAPPP